MPKARQIRELLRRRMAASAGGSVSEAYQPYFVTSQKVLSPDEEERLYRRIDEALKKYARVVLPAALQTEYEALPNIINALAQVHNEIIDYLEADPLMPSSRIIQGLIELQRLASRYTNRLTKVAQYLKKPLPALTPLRYAPFIIWAGRFGRFVGRFR